MATSRLEKIGVAARTTELSRNKFSDADEYNASHPAAKTPLGKESDGNTDDMMARSKQLGKNMFSSANEYGPTNLY